MLAAAFVAAIACASQAQAICDVCGVRNDHTKDYSTPFEAGANFPACNNYQDGACCDFEAVQKIAAGYTFYDDESEKYDMAACDNASDRNTSAAGKAYSGMSEGCKAFFEAEYCFYECDVNTAKYRKHPDCKDGEDQNGWEIANMPIKKSYCDSWYEACKNDYFCTDFAAGDDSYYTHAYLNAAGNCTFGSNNCRTIGTIYGSGQAICEVMWGDAFLYDTTNEGYVMDFEQGQPNPNDAIYTNVIPPEPCPNHEVDEAERDQVCGETEGFTEHELKPCEVCHLRNDHTADIAAPLPELSSTDGPCSKYADNACCTLETVNKLHENGQLYGETAYRWDKCYIHHTALNDTLQANATLKAAYDKCSRWFTVEECFYECDVNAGKWRKEEDCTDAEGSNAWQIEALPFKASECDQFYEDCKDLRMCTCTDLDSCPEKMTPYSLFGSADADSVCQNTTDYCMLISDVWQSPKEWCEKLWDNSFKYEEHEPAAYSWVWNDEVLAIDDYTHPSNPNNKVHPNRDFPPNCPSHDATPEMCMDGEIVNEPPATSGVEEESPEPGATATNSMVACALMALVAHFAL